MSAPFRLGGNRQLTSEVNVTSVCPTKLGERAKPIQHKENAVVSFRGNVSPTNWNQTCVM
jgi:hypothetical protein